jgi:hypothetical protein
MLKEESMRHILFAILILLACLFSNSLAVIDSLEIPFGVHGMGGDYDSGHLDTLGLLGLNYISEMSNDLIGSNIDAVYSRHGMQVARGGKPYNGTPGDTLPEAPFKYSYSNYAAIDVGMPNGRYANREVRMVSIDSGGYYNDNCWVSPQNSIDTLSGISTLDSVFYRAYNGGFEDDPLKNRVAFDNKYYYDYPGQNYIAYHLRIKASINNPDITDDTTLVAKIRLRFGYDGDSYWWPPCSLFTEKNYSLFVNQFDTLSSVHNIEISTFTIPDTVEMSHCNGPHEIYFREGPQERWAPYVVLEIATTGNRQLAIDSIFIYDQFGQLLVEAPYILDAEIAAKIHQYTSRAEKIFAWEMLDEPLYANFKPIQHIKNLIDSVDTDGSLNWKIYTYNWKYNPGPTRGERLTHSWHTIVGEPLRPDIFYPFCEDCDYSGTHYQNETNWNGDNRPGPLASFNRDLSWVRDQIKEDSTEFWVALQAHSSEDNFLRIPASSELSCETFMALSWGVKGINYYFYDWDDMGDGIIDTDGNPTPLYDELKSYIGPYIQAIDEFYMPLVWQRSYPYHTVSAPINSPPSSAFVNSIAAVSDPCQSALDEDEQCFNPDVGWFQVGEYNGGPGDPAKYILIVNRACNNNFDNVAPSITATLHLNAANLNLGDYAHITDLADSLYHHCDTCDWEGVPKTTYSATMPDGTIPYTITPPRWRRKADKDNHGQ